MLFPWLTVFDFRTFAANFKKSIDIKEINNNTYDDVQFYKDKLKRRLTADERISTKLRTNYTV